MTYKVHITYDPSTDEDSLFLFREEGGRKEYARVEWVECGGSGLAEPTFRLWSEGPRRSSLLNAIVDSAWEFGVRPAQIEDQRNQVRALLDHLDDLRKVAFKGLKIDG